MNVVGRVGSLITQGVYSVATPFHPFGGAVDIIVVQQQDGSFRSTPWYVQFGKFQGVLKGAEKVVRIKVNGVEANFHMYLDNSGEAYFIREADSGKDIKKNGVSKDETDCTLEHSLSVDNNQFNINKDDVENYRLQSTMSDPGVLRDDCSSFGPDRLERTDSDVCRFYDFQDDQPFEGSVDLSPDFGSSRYDNIEAIGNFVEAQASDSEMVLVSVDGHILTAPISSSVQNTENVQLLTPQFHLGPGEGSGFCEGDSVFAVGENAWDSEYLNGLDASSCKPDSLDSSCENDNIHHHESLPKICKVEGHAVSHEGIDGMYQLGTSDMNELEACKKDQEFAHQESKDLETGEENGKGEDEDKESQEMHIVETGEEDGEHVEGDRGVEDMRQPEAGEEDREHAHQGQEPNNIKSQERDAFVLNDVEDTSPGIKNEGKFKSSLDLTIAADYEDSALHSREEAKDVEEKPSQDVQVSNTTQIKYAPESSSVQTEAVTEINLKGVAMVKRVDDSNPSASDLLSRSPFLPPVSSDVSQTKERVYDDIETIDSNCISGGNVSAFENQQVNLNPLVKIAKNCSNKDVCEAESNRTGSLEPQTESLSDGRQANLSTSFEISLCRHLLHPGMGLSAAGEAFNAHRICEKEFGNTAASVIKNENLVIRYREKYLPWDKAAPIVLGMAAFGLDLSIEAKDAIPVELEVTQNLGENDSGSASGRRWRLWPIPFRRVKPLQHSNSNASEVFVDSESVSHSPSIEQTPTSQSSTPKSETSFKSYHKKIVRTNIPTNEQIMSLNLKEGQNDVTFSFSTRVLGLQQVEAHIYLWKWNARIVISDVDGTITKSDVLGQFMPLVGKDWSQSGVARLFSAIKENGYQLLFLSARAIVQAYLTKSFLFNLKQDGKTLPTGPVVISPDGLFPSLFREVIRRAPHEFKIACLEDIKALFPSDYNPFYAGFGNRDTDELTYRKIGIPKGKIFIINPKGEVAINQQVDVKSYISLHTLVNDMFPPTSMVEQEDYNSWNYWKMPLPDIDY